MSAYFEPISVRSLADILGFADVPAATCRPGCSLDPTSWLRRCRIGRGCLQQRSMRDCAGWPRSARSSALPPPKFSLEGPRFLLARQSPRSWHRPIAMSQCLPIPTGTTFTAPLVSRPPLVSASIFVPVTRSRATRCVLPWMSCWSGASPQDLASTWRRGPLPRVGVPGTDSVACSAELTLSTVYYWRTCSGRAGRCRLLPRRYQR